MVNTDTPTVAAEPRERIGTRYSRRLREAGRLPAVIYGHKEEAVHVSVCGKEFVDLLHEGAHLVQLEVAGKTEACIVKDIQWDHLGSDILHVDLTRVDLNEEVEVDIDLHFTGDAVGLKEAGAVLDHPLSTLKIKCRANAIPEEISHDISALEAGGSVHISDLQLPAGVSCDLDGETVIAHIMIAKAVEEEETAEAGDGEPEVINKGKEEEAAE